MCCDEHQIKDWFHIPLDRPRHDVVEEDEGGRNVENLLAESAPSVEDGIVGGTGE